MKLRLPTPPSLNNAYVNVPGRGRVPSRELTAWKKEAQGLIFNQWMNAGQPKFHKHYALHYRFNIDHKSDIGNREKCATDLIVATIPGFPGDQWADQISIIRDRTIDGAIVEVVQL